MTARGLVFGSVAADYERYRPGYPAQVATEVVAYAGRPIRNALELGAGTGKATRCFAAHGIAVTATDPDPAMVEELRRNVPATVTVRRAALEDLSPEPTHDLVVAAAALHWTTPTGRWQRIAAQLTSGGVFAAIGGPLQLADHQVERAVREARSPWLATDEVPVPDTDPEDSSMPWPANEIFRSGLFTDVRHQVIERRLTRSASDVVGHLRTISAYATLPGPDRAAALAAVAAVLPPAVELVADVHLHLARLA